METDAFLDVVSEVDLHEVTNAVDQTNQKSATDASISARRGANDTITKDSEFQIRQVVDILHKWPSAHRHCRAQ